MTPMLIYRLCFFFFNDTATTEIYTLSLHDALPIFHAPLDEPHPLLAGALEQVHAELLAAEPSAPARVQQGDRVLREIGKVPANERAIRDDEIGRASCRERV